MRCRTAPDYLAAHPRHFAHLSGSHSSSLPGERLLPSDMQTQYLYVCICIVLFGVMDYGKPGRRPKPQ